MTFDEYQKQSYTAIQEHESNKEEVMHWTIGLGEESGEVMQLIKHMYYGAEAISKEQVATEIGDVLWYLAALCTALDIDLNVCARMNVLKLLNRYNSGSFTEEESKRRHITDEELKRTESYELLKSQLECKAEESRNDGIHISRS